MHDLLISRDNNLFQIERIGFGVLIQSDPIHIILLRQRIAVIQHIFPHSAIYFASSEKSSRPSV